MAMAVPFYPCKTGTKGPHVEGYGRAMARALEKLPWWKRVPVKRRWGWWHRHLANELKKGEGWKQDGAYDKKLHALLLDHGAFDAYAEALVRQHHPAKPKPKPKPPVGDDLSRVKAALVAFCRTGLAHPWNWNYTQNRPVDVTVDPAGHVNSDCSGSIIQAFRWARDKTGVNFRDPGGFNWSGYGNTNWYLRSHPRVSGQYFVGDCAFYGHGSTTTHVTMCIRAGDARTSRWWSFGSEPPQERALYYRTDFMFVVRPLADIGVVRRAINVVRGLFSVAAEPPPEAFLGDPGDGEAAPPAE